MIQNSTRSCLRNSVVFLALSLLLNEVAIAVPAQGQKIMISAPSPYAVEIGREISRKGGNVVDVAIGVALSLAVTSPYYAALGGGGFALVKVGGVPVQALDFREFAPSGAGRDLFAGKPKEASTDGALAVAVPGVPAGLWALHKKYGQMDWSRLFRRPIELAEKGFEVSGEWEKNTQKTLRRFNPSGKKIFSNSNGGTYIAGYLLKQAGLAKLLKEMSNRGPVPFYSGSAALDIVSTVKERGGILTLSDLKSYSVRWFDPMVTHFNGYKLYLMPPPSSGGVILKTALKLIELDNLKDRKAFSIEELHRLGQILRLSFRSRSLLGDPAFNKLSVENLTADNALLPLSKLIRDNQMADIEQLPALPDGSDQTTHLSVVDYQGNAVSMTLTLNGLYGSGLVTSNYGIVLNNQMDDFTTRPNEPNQFGLIQGSANFVEAKKRPLSSMSPTLVEKDGKILIAVGAPGGPRIISSVLQVLYRTLVTGLDIDQAIQAPRIHHQFQPNILYFDGFISPEVITGLKSKGHQMEESPVGRVFAVKRNSDGILAGAHDSRGEGASGGF